jgi:hypothetical protein
VAANEPTNHIQLSGAETPIAGDPKRYQPEFAGLVFPLHVDVRRLVTVEACEEAAVWSRNTFDSRHSRTDVCLCYRSSSIAWSSASLGGRVFDSGSVASGASSMLSMSMNVGLDVST